MLICWMISLPNPFPQVGEWWTDLSSVVSLKCQNNPQTTLKQLSNNPQTTLKQPSNLLTDLTTFSFYLLSLLYPFQHRLAAIGLHDLPVKFNHLRIDLFRVEPFFAGDRSYVGQLFTFGNNLCMI